MASSCSPRENKLAWKVSKPGLNMPGNSTDKAPGFGALPTPVSPNLLFPDAPWQASEELEACMAPYISTHLSTYGSLPASLGIPELCKMPCVRRAELRELEEDGTETQMITDTMVLSLLVYLTGVQAQKPCDHCRKTKGVYKTCVFMTPSNTYPRVLDGFRDMCANEIYRQRRAFFQSPLPTPTVQRSLSPLGLFPDEPSSPTMHKSLAVRQHQKRSLKDASSGEPERPAKKTKTVIVLSDDESSSEDDQDHESIVHGQNENRHEEDDLVDRQDHESIIRTQRAHLYEEDDIMAGNTAHSAEKEISTVQQTLIREGSHHTDDTILEGLEPHGGVLWRTDHQMVAWSIQKRTLISGRSFEVAPGIALQGHVVHSSKTHEFGVSSRASLHILINGLVVVNVKDGKDEQMSKVWPQGIWKVVPGKTCHVRNIAYPDTLVYTLSLESEQLKGFVLRTLASGESWKWPKRSAVVRVHILHQGKVNVSFGGPDEETVGPHGVWVVLPNEIGKVTCMGRTDAVIRVLELAQ